MTLSIWRYAHLALAIISSLFLVMASVTGAILAIDAIQEKMPPYRVANFDNITLAQSIPVLKEKFSEISEIEVDHNGFVLLKDLITMVMKLMLMSILRQAKFLVNS